MHLYVYVTWQSMGALRSFRRRGGTNTIDGSKLAAGAVALLKTSFLAVGREPAAKIFLRLP